MVEYFIIRAFLAVCLIFLKDAAIPREFRLYLGFMAIYQLLPQALYSAIWWRTIWLPLEIVGAALAWSASRRLFRLVTHATTFWDERINTLTFLSVVAIAFVMFGWLWIPQNWFQMVVSVRQYYRMGLFVFATGAAALYGWLRPVAIEPDVRIMGLFWCAWLACQFIMSTTGAGGIARISDLTQYRAVCDIAMTAQCFVTAWAAINLPRRH